MSVERPSIQYRLEDFGFRTLPLITGALGLRRSAAMSAWLWRHIAPLTRRHKRALTHLARSFPEKAEPELQAICREMWDNLGRNLAEAFFLKRLVEEDRVQYEGIEAFETWAGTPGGKVACAGHLANWELAIAPASRRGLDPWSIYQRVKNPLVDRRVAAIRSFLYTGGLVPKSTTLSRQFLRIVRDGGTIGFLADLRDHNGIAVPFFGRPAPSTPFPALLARSVGTPILVSCMRRLPGSRFVQSFTLVRVPETDDRRADIAAATAEIQAVFERFIRQWPEQWMWAHRRWG